MARTKRLILACGVCLLASCRKAEPEEIVSAPRRSTLPPASYSAGGSAPMMSGGSGGAVDGAGAVAGGIAGAAAEDQCAFDASGLDGPFTKRKLLESAARCAMLHYCQFRTHAQRLRAAVAAYAANPISDAKATAQHAFIGALNHWEQVETFRFGPASPAPQGQDLRDRIYAWPREVRCKIDEQTVSRFYATSDFLGTPAQSFVTGRSLLAVEYLLFYSGTDNGCTQYSAINANGSWAALSAPELSQRKVEYALAAAQDVASSASILLNSWEPANGNYYRDLVEAGAGSSAFPDEQSALNSVNYGLFYLEKEVKDWKLAVPLGLSPDCPAANCPDRVESRYARPIQVGLANRNLQANLKGFRRLFQGCGEKGEGVGFDDWLREVGAGELADRMILALDTADEVLAGLDVPLEVAVVTQPERALRVYNAIKELSDPLKSEFLSILNLQVPKGSETDND